MARLVYAVLILVAVGMAASSATSAPAGWPVYQQNPMHSGVAPENTAATSPDLAWTATVDGPIYAQPLVVGSTVYVATENNTVYAFDASSNTPVWSQHLATPAPSGSLPCGNITPGVGITGTPVIDTANNVLYVAPLVDQPSIHYELWALDLSQNGTPRYHFSLGGSGFDATTQGQRGALALASDKVFVPFGGRFGDCGTYHGVVMSANASDATGASLQVVTETTSNAGGIWAAGGIVVDASGNLLVATGNTGETSTYARGESVLKLSASTLSVLDYFAPSDWLALDQHDIDIGSIAPTVLQNGWIFQSGKNAIGYLIDGANMGHVGGQLYAAQVCNDGGEAMGSTAYDASNNTVYVPCTSSLKAVHIKVSGTPSFSVTSVREGYSGDPGANPPIVAAGYIWNIDSGNQLLLGFDRTTNVLQYSLSLPHVPAHFAVPAAAAGHIFVADGSTLVAFSLGSAPTPSRTPTLTPTATPTPTTVAAATATATPGPRNTGGGGGGGGNSSGGRSGSVAGDGGTTPSSSVIMGGSGSPPAPAPAPTPTAQPASGSQPVQVTGGTTTAVTGAAPLRSTLALDNLGVQVAAPLLDNGNTVGLANLTPLSTDSLPQPPEGFAFGIHAFAVEAITPTGQPVTTLDAPLTLTVTITPGELAQAGGDTQRTQLARVYGSRWVGVGCASEDSQQTLTCSAPAAGRFALLIAPPLDSTLDWDIPDGHVFKQANGFGGGGDLGYTVVDDANASFWTEFQRWGGAEQVGYPISNRFTYRGFLTQAFQKLVLQWRPELDQAVPFNVLDELDQHGSNTWLEVSRDVPRPAEWSSDRGLAWSDLVEHHLALLDGYPILRDFYLAQADAIDRFGLPVIVHDYGSLVSVRLQRATLQLWQVDTPWAEAGTVVVGNGGDLGKEAGLWPADAVVPSVVSMLSST